MSETPDLARVRDAWIDRRDFEQQLQGARTLSDDELGDEFDRFIDNQTVEVLDVVTVLIERHINQCEMHGFETAGLKIFAKDIKVLRDATASGEEDARDVFEGDPYDV